MKCKNHNIVTEISNAADFDNVPEGGCKEICAVRLNCGHSCESFCHPYEISVKDPTGHSSIKCLK